MKMHYLLGVNFVQRKIAVRATTYLDIHKEGDEWVWKLSVLVFTELYRFVPGDEFDYVIMPSKTQCKVSWLIILFVGRI